jgi:predicted O-methyltransferase YrrM
MAFGELRTKVKALFPSSELRNNAAQKLSSSSGTLSLEDMKRMQREILRFLFLRGHFVVVEGSSTPEQLLYLASVVKRTDARLVGEIGFNAGFSSYAFLSADSKTRLVSFDLGKRTCTKTAKRLIDKRFPTRHTLIYGDSRKTVPEFKSRNPTLHFDLVFIDGGHAYEVAKADIANMKPLCTEKTVVVMDDLMPWRRWGTGPTRAWTEAIREGIIRQDELFKDGKPADVIEPPGKRSWALGRYIFKNSLD